GKFGLQFLFGQLVLQSGHLWQAILERREAFARNQRLQVVTAILGDAKAVITDVVNGHFLFLVGNVAQWRFANVPAIGPGLVADDDRHHGLLAIQRHFYRGLANGVGLLDIGGRGDVACSPLQVVGNRPVILVAQRLLDHVGEGRRNATELGMAKGVLVAGIGKEAAVLVL